MKKLLALVLALVMTLSLAVVGSNAAFTDADKVNETYAEAVDVLAGMKVFQGYTDGSFNPTGDITRAEVAAIVYRIYTADVKDANVGLYAGYGSFTDLAGATWAQGYIGYCANAGLVKGYDAKTFGPSDKVTGYQALAMILRAMGYDKNGEFTGAGWELHVAQIAQQLGILKNAGSENLNNAASRQLVAELLFQAIQKPCVTYTPAFGYVANSVVGAQASLGEKNFGLTKSGNTADVWGRPSHLWYDSRKTTSGNYVEGTSTLYATITDKADATYTTAVTECDVAKDVGVKTNKTFITYTNGMVNASNDTIVATQTIQKIGAQGRLTEVYMDAGVIVYIDTLLAKVVSVADATFDTAGHLRTASSITLNVYDTNTTTTGDNQHSPIVNNTTYTKVTETNGETNYTYTKGQYVLVNAVQYATNRVRANADQYVDIVGAADSIVGAETIIWYNSAQHTVDGTLYNDNNRFHLDEAGQIGVNHTWFFDTYGNLIGAIDLAADPASYGVITNLYWTNNDGVGSAYATVTYLDGKTDTVKVGSIDVYSNNAYVEDCAPVYALSAGALTTATDTTAKTSTVGVSTWANDNAAAANSFVNNDLFAITTLSNGTVKFDAVSELTSATVKTGVSAVTGTAGKGSSATSIFTNSDTVYLVRTGTAAKGYTYTTVTGFNNIGNYVTNKAVVDYVNGTDGYVAYAFVTGTPDAAQASKLVYVTGNNYSAYVDAKGVTHYVVNAVSIEGAATTVDTTSYALVAKLVSGVNKLFYVNYEDEVATQATEVTTWAYDYTNGTDVSAAYGANMVAVKIDGAVVTGQVLANKSGSVRFNVSNATTYAGDLANIEDNVAYLLLNKSTLYVTGVYVTSTPASSTAPATVTLTEDDANVSIASNTVFSVTANELVTNVALVNKGDWAKQGVDAYTVTANDGTTNWTVSNVKVEGNTMTFDLTAPAAVSGNITLTLTWSAK